MSSLSFIGGCHVVFGLWLHCLRVMRSFLHCDARLLHGEQTAGVSWLTRMTPGDHDAHVLTQIRHELDSDGPYPLRSRWHTHRCVSSFLLELSMFKLLLSVTRDLAELTS